MNIAVNDILKHPTLISAPTEVVYIEDRRKKELRSIVFPASYMPLLSKVIEEIEYKNWFERNKKALESENSFGDISNPEDVGAML